jgi:hypothetical protein
MQYIDYKTTMLESMQFLHRGTCDIYLKRDVPKEMYPSIHLLGHHVGNHTLTL